MNHTWCLKRVFLKIDKKIWKNFAVKEWCNLYFNFRFSNVLQKWVVLIFHSKCTPKLPAQLIKLITMSLFHSSEKFGKGIICSVSQGYLFHIRQIMTSRFAYNFLLDPWGSFVSMSCFDFSLKMYAKTAGSVDKVDHNEPLS